MTIDEVVFAAKEARASDIHIVNGLPLRCRVDGQMTDLVPVVLTERDTLNYAIALTGDRFDELEQTGEIDLARTFGDNIRTRINVFRQQGAYSAVLRILSDHIPSLGELTLPSVVQTLPDYRTGIILVTGETGSGKSTTLAAVLDKINHTRRGHIITLEDPIEYIYTPDKCVINQREIGKDTRSYPDGLRAILRQDPDVILIGEMRDLSTIEAAITAAETGHLVFATLHTNSAADSIDRIVNVFPQGQQQQIRLQLSTTLRVVLSQQLVPQVGGGRICACEVMVVTAAIRNLIREGKTPQIESFITMNAQGGSITMDAALLKLVREGTITAETALSYARDKEAFSMNLPSNQPTPIRTAQSVAEKSGFRRR